jgi:hypothetical protein
MPHVPTCSKTTNCRGVLSKALSVTVASAMVSGCVTAFEENHYFQSINEESGQVTNYYRLRVDGYAYFSSARYVSGYYDERAVDMFFNEMKIAATPPGTSDTGSIFDDDLSNPGTEEKIKPLSPDDTHGAFLMVLSTNASSVTNTIGQFAESQIVADAVTNLANRELLEGDRANNERAARHANATSEEIRKLLELVPGASAPDKEDTIRSLIRVLNAIALGIDDNIKPFESFSDADAWLTSALARRSQ